MKLEFRLTGKLYTEIVHDLLRPHPFAAERIGFVAGRIGTLQNGGSLILLTRYHSIPDQQYVDDPSVGARIDATAITWATQAAYHGRPNREGIFHIHLHAHGGETGMSSTDQREIPTLIPGFRAVGRRAAHGIIVLSLNHGYGLVWLPGHENPIVADCFSVIGTPIQVFEREVRK